MDTRLLGDEESGDRPSRSGNASAKRRRVSQACMNCRRRKIKCKGLTRDKACDSCVALGTECVLVRDGDRRKIGSREQVSVLRDRIQCLESILATMCPQADQYPIDSYGNDAGNSHVTLESSIAPPENLQSLVQENNFATPPADPFDDSNITVRANIHADTRNTCASQSSGEPPAEQQQKTPVGDDSSEIIVRGSASNQSQSNVADSASNVVQGSSSFPAFHELSPAQSISVQSKHPDGYLEIDETLGGTRFYGHTSQSYIQAMDGKDTQHDETGPDDTNSTTLNPDGKPLVDMLLDIFFRAQPLTVVVINQDVFQKGRQLGCRTQGWSEFLQYTVLACATRMSTSVDLRKLGTRYAACARSLITRELESPTTATLQGFLLLSDFEATRGRDRLGYMYCGIASILVFDLGLTEDCADLVERGKMTNVDTELRHTLLLAVYVFDKLWAMYLGRPSGIPSAMVAKAHQRALSRGWHCPASLEQWVGLCSELSQITELLIHSSLVDESSVKRLLAVDQRIQRRHEGLTTPLYLNAENIADLEPSVYGLQIQFYGARIVLHGLVHKAMRADDPSTETAATNERVRQTDASRRVMCVGAAMVVRLVSTYRQIFGIQNMVTIMLDNMYVAATILISYASQWQHQGCHMPDVQYQLWIQTLADIFHEAQCHYPVTSRMLATLAASVKDTALASVFENLEPRSHSRTPSALLNGHLRAASTFTMDTHAAGMFGDSRRVEVQASEPVYDDDSGQGLFGDLDMMNLFPGLMGNPLDWTLPGTCV